jgi:hypothetical protein
VEKHRSRDPEWNSLDQGWKKFGSGIPTTLYLLISFLLFSLISLILAAVTHEAISQCLLRMICCMAVLDEQCAES